MTKLMIVHGATSSFQLLKDHINATGIFSETQLLATTGSTSSDFNLATVQGFLGVGDVLILNDFDLLNNTVGNKIATLLETGVTVIHNMLYGTRSVFRQLNLFTAEMTYTNTSDQTEQALANTDLNYAGKTNLYDVFQTRRSYGYLGAVDTSAVAGSVIKLAYRLGNQKQTTMCYAPVGSTILTKVTTAPLIFASGIYFSDTPSSVGNDFKNILIDLIALHPAKKHVITGTVKEKGTNTPLQREVSAYRKSDSKLVKKTTSDVNGNFTLELPTTEEYTLVCKGNLSLSQNSQVRDLPAV